MMNTEIYFYGLNKIYKSFSVDNIEELTKTLNIKGFRLQFFKTQVLEYVDEMDRYVEHQ